MGNNVIQEKLDEFLNSWHADHRFHVEKASLGNRYDFVAYLMRSINSHSTWGAGASSPSDEDALRNGKPTQCLGMCRILSQMVRILGMPSVFVNFCGPRSSHWGLDVQLSAKNTDDVGHWAFFDPTYIFCMKDRRIGSVGVVPLNSEDISNGRTDIDMVDTWHRHFNPLHSSFGESQSMAYHFKQGRIYSVRRGGIEPPPSDHYESCALYLASIDAVTKSGDIFNT